MNHHTFADLFEPNTLTHDRTIGETYRTTGPDHLKRVDPFESRKRYIYHNVSGFVSQERGSDGAENLATSFYAKPTALLIDIACTTLFPIKYDTIYFKAVVHADEVRLFAKHNVILSNHPPIAVVPIADWPVVKD